MNPTQSSQECAARFAGSWIAPPPPTDNIVGLIEAARIAVEKFDTAENAVRCAEAPRNEAVRKAAQAMAAAHGAGATQTNIAKAVNKSQAWVSAMIAWHHKGCDGTTVSTVIMDGEPWRKNNKPFAEASKTAREKRADKYQSRVKTDKSSVEPWGTNSDYLAAAGYPPTPAGYLPTRPPVQELVASKPLQIPAEVIAAAVAVPLTVSQENLGQLIWAVDKRWPKINADDRVKFSMHVLDKVKVKAG